MNDFLDNLGQGIVTVSDWLCGYPEFFLLIGGGLFLFLRSGAISLRRFPHAMRALRHKQAGDRGRDQISSVQALLSAIAATVGMGNIAGVAIAVTIGGPGVIFWMWVSALVGMSTKFFEGALSVMYRSTDKDGNPQGGPMYIITEGLGQRWRPLAVAFAIFGLVGTLCLTQANQLVESVTTVFTTPMGIENTAWLRAGMGVVMALIVGTVILGGINRIAAIASRIVPAMVILYLILVTVIMVVHYDRLPAVFASIITGAFNWEAGFGAFALVALTGARRAALVNEAGVGTASMMHGASHNTEPVREGLIAMLEPLIDSGIVCTLTSIPIIMAIDSIDVEGVKGLYVALNAFGNLLPGVGHYLLMAIVFFFAFSTMFSYSYYGQKCTAYLFGPGKRIYYNIYYLAMIVVAAVISLDVMVALMDVAFLLMAVCTMTAIILLAPRVMALTRPYFNKPE